MYFSFTKTYSLPNSIYEYNLMLLSDSEVVEYLCAADSDKKWPTKKKTQQKAKAIVYWATAKYIFKQWIRSMNFKTFYPL